jgi:hypothetical protein
MTDIFEFESPAGIIGKFFNRVFLKNYMKNLLSERNEIIKKRQRIVNRKSGTHA